MQRVQRKEEYWALEDQYDGELLRLSIDDHWEDISVAMSLDQKTCPEGLAHLTSDEAKELAAGLIEVAKLIDERWTSRKRKKKVAPIKVKVLNTTRVINGPEVVDPNPSS